MKKITLIIIINIFFSVHLRGQDSPVIDEPDDKAGSASDFRNFVREGNRQYNSGRSENAERSFRRALDIDNRSNIATFNLGSSLYRQDRFDEAEKEFEKAASGANEKIDRAQAYHNLGNSLLLQQKVQESIEAYKQALRNNPNDFDTKYNLSYAMNLLREQEQQQNNQDGQNQQDQNQDNQSQQQQQDQDMNENRQQQPQISREDAQRMLDAIAQDEKELLEKLQQKERAGNRPNIEKNW